MTLKQSHLTHYIRCNTANTVEGCGLTLYVADLVQKYFRVQTQNFKSSIMIEVDTQTSQREQIISFYLVALFDTN